MATIKTIGIWFGINKNKKPSYHIEKPTRGNGVWISKSPFCSSVLCSQLDDMIMNTPLTWENDAEYIEIPLKDIEQM